MTLMQTGKIEVFVSYAHVDDLAPGQSEGDGWVTNLIRSLQALLARRLDRADHCEFWMGPRFESSNTLTPTTEEKIRHSAVFLIILSESYLASAWCQAELKQIMEELQQRVSKDQLFVIELGPIDRPATLYDRVGYRFWEADPLSRRTRLLGFPRPCPEDYRYYDLLNDLSYDLAKELNFQLTTPKSEGQWAIGERSTVFLAEATDDMAKEHESIRRYLMQAGLDVLPDSVYSSPFDLEWYREKTRANLARATLFVQLLSAVPGRKFPGQSWSVLRMQYDLARELRIPVLQWRPRWLEIASVTDIDHRALLSGPEVIEQDFEEFKRFVRSRVAEHGAELLSRSATLVDRIVFINHDASDRQLAEEVAENLVGRGINCALSLRSGDPAEAREDFEQNLILCDAVLFIYGNCSPAWLRAQLLLSRKLLYRRESPLMIGIFEGPPPDKEDLSLRLPNMRIIDSRHGLDPAQLGRFAEALDAWPRP